MAWPITALTHVSDASCWLFKGSFELSIKETLRTWGLLWRRNLLVGRAVVMLLTLVVSGA